MPVLLHALQDGGLTSSQRPNCKKKKMVGLKVSGSRTRAASKSGSLLKVAMPLLPLSGTVAQRLPMLQLLPQRQPVRQEAATKLKFHLTRLEVVTKSPLRHLWPTRQQRATKEGPNRPGPHLRWLSLAATE